jgi:hypothetical protein
MKRKTTQGGDRTFETIRSRYDTWAEHRPPRSVEAYEDWTPHGPEPEVSMSKMITTAIGVGIGVLLLLLAGLAFWTASNWAGFGREPAVIGYILTGCFLIVAGAGGILATLYHNFRVLDPNRRPAHGHH